MSSSSDTGSSRSACRSLRALWEVDELSETSSSRMKQPIGHASRAFCADNFMSCAFHFAVHLGDLQVGEGSRLSDVAQAVSLRFVELVPVRPLAMCASWQLAPHGIT